jgi:nicotinate-nucleotide adenylyltransferase
MDTATSSQPLVLVLGGSFNPPHAGHFRIAIESYEALSPREALFLPCATPPHKPADTLLPFGLRVALLRAGLDEAGMKAHFTVCEVENERCGPSYTADTLTVLKERHPGRRLAFVMGAEDYAQLPVWRRWRELPSLADLVIAPRGENGRQAFCDTTLRLWPRAQKAHVPLSGEAQTYLLPGAGRAIFLDLPRLVVSSSMMRERWLRGRSLDFLTPRSVLRLLREQETLVRTVWGAS